MEWCLITAVGGLLLGTILGGLRANGFPVHFEKLKGRYRVLYMTPNEFFGWYAIMEYCQYGFWRDPILVFFPFKKAGELEPGNILEFSRDKKGKTHILIQKERNCVGDAFCEIPWEIPVD